MFNFYKDRTTLIAEIGGNHEGDILKAKELMFQAHESGADIIKFQSYSGKGLVNKNLRPKRYEHFNKFMLTDDEWIELGETAIKNNILFASSIWEEKYFKLLDDYICVYKVGSGDLNNFNLLKLFLSTKKPLILSTAMSNLEQIKIMYKFITDFDKNIIEDSRLAILQCTAMYDEPLSSNVNMSVMVEFKNIFKCLVGFSNHAIGVNASLAAISHGAAVLEFHFTDTKNAEFRDHKLSFDAQDLKIVSSFNKEFHNIMGNSKKIIHKSEKDNEIEFRRGIFLNKGLKKGEIVKEEDLIFLRPQIGIALWDLHDLIGKKALKDISPFNPLEKEFFK